MAANFLGLFVLILGTTGISKMLSHAEMADYALRSYWNQFKPYYGKDDRESLDCRYKYRPYACKNVYNPPNFGPFPDYNINSKRQENFIPGQFYPYLRRNYIEELSERMQKLMLEDRASTVTTEVKQNENGNSDDAYSSSESIISSTQHDNSIEKHTIKRQDVSNYFRSVSSTLSDKSGNSIQPDTTLSAITNMASDLYVTDQSFSDLKISSESMKDTTIKTSSKDTTEYKSTFFTKRLTDATDQSNIDPITSYSPTSDNKKINTISSTTTSSSQEHLTKSKDERFQKTEDSIVLQDNSSVISEEVTPLKGESSSTVGIISTNNQDSDLESTQPQNTSLSTADKTISSDIESSSSQEMYSSSSQTSVTGTVTPKISTILITDDTTLYSKLSSSSDIKSTDGKTSNDKSSTDYFTSSNKFISTPSTIKDIESDTTFSTKSTSKNQVTSVDIPKDHIIEISSIHTARIIITSVFLVIALVAITVLAVYIFKLKRKTVYYDQLLLLP